MTDRPAAAPDTERVPPAHIAGKAGAAPSVDELDVERLATALLAEGVVPMPTYRPDWSASGINGAVKAAETQARIMARAIVTRLRADGYRRLSGAPQEGRAECKRFRHDEHCDH